jgi:hypothetical protein
MKVFGPGSFFFNLMQMLVLHNNNTSTGTTRPGLIPRELGFTYPSQFKMDDTIYTLLMDILSNQPTRSQVSSIPTTNRVSIDFKQRIRNSYATHQARLQTQLWGDDPPTVTISQGGNWTVTEPNMNELVNSHVATKEKSASSKKAIVAAALRNMREFEMVTALYRLLGLSR